MWRVLFFILLFGMLVLATAWYRFYGLAHHASCIEKPMACWIAAFMVVLLNVAGYIAMGGLLFGVIYWVYRRVCRLKQ